MLGYLILEFFHRKMNGHNLLMLFKLLYAIYKPQKSDDKNWIMLLRRKNIELCYEKSISCTSNIFLVIGNIIMTRAKPQIHFSLLKRKVAKKIETFNNRKKLSSILLAWIFWALIWRFNGQNHIEIPKSLHHWI